MQQCLALKLEGSCQKIACIHRGRAEANSWGIGLKPQQVDRISRKRTPHDYLQYALSREARIPPVLSKMCRSNQIDQCSM